MWWLNDWKRFKHKQETLQYIILKKHQKKCYNIVLEAERGR
jgi:hypothetical protein